jgi:hypothetical protein
MAGPLNLPADTERLIARNDVPSDFSSVERIRENLRAMSGS